MYDKDSPRGDLKQMMENKTFNIVSKKKCFTGLRMCESILKRMDSFIMIFIVFLLIFTYFFFTEKTYLTILSAFLILSQEVKY